MNITKYITRINLLLMLKPKIELFLHYIILSDIISLMKLITFLRFRDIFIGDALVQINDTVLRDISHDQALTLLAEAGPTVTLLLKHYKAATPFLLKQFGR